MLRKHVENMPTTSVRLGVEKPDGKIDEASALDFTIPISDHDVILASNKNGVFATWNILNPDSPVASGILPKGTTGLRRLYIEEQRQEHLNQVARFIIELFKLDVDAIALQEVPDKKNNTYFADFLEKLNSLAKENNIDYDFALEKSYRQTKKPLKNGNEQGYHGFGTAILFNPNNIKLNNVTPHPDGRGATYSLHSYKSKEDFNLVNLHGDYAKHSELIEFIASEFKKPNTMILGDTNIALSYDKTVSQFKFLTGVSIEPTTNLEGTPNDKRTLDCIVSNIASNYIYKKKDGCSNYASLEIATNCTNKLFTTNQTVCEKINDSENLHLINNTF